jgi:hypothetical protein
MRDTSNKILVSKVDTSKLTRGQYYKATSSNGIVRFTDNNGMEYKIPSDKVLKYFHIPVTLPDYESFTMELGVLRAVSPECTCGAWAIKDYAHSKWCDSIKKL